MIAEAVAFAQSTPGETVPVAATKALPFVSPIFGDNMVLQRGKPDAIWGWSDPGDTVRLQIGEHSATATSAR
jgi:sialate O-acetylesterase